MVIVLVRHGFSKGNLNQVYSGWTDVPLTPEGIEELQTYRDVYDYPETERYYCSDLVRCRHTFDVLFGDRHKLYEVSDQLREIYFGKYENLKDELVEPGYFSRWITNHHEADHETITRFAYRVVSKLEKILEDMQNNRVNSATIVCHAGVIRILLIMLGNRPYADFLEIPVPNGLGYVLQVDYNDHLGQIRLNDVSELHQKSYYLAENKAK